MKNKYIKKKSYIGNFFIILLIVVLIVASIFIVKSFNNKEKDFTPLSIDITDRTDNFVQLNYVLNREDTQVFDYFTLGFTINKNSCSFTYSNNVNGFTYSDIHDGYSVTFEKLASMLNSGNFNIPLIDDYVLVPNFNETNILEFQDYLFNDVDDISSNGSVKTYDVNLLNFNLFKLAKNNEILEKGKNEVIGVCAITHQNIENKTMLRVENEGYSIFRINDGENTFSLSDQLNACDFKDKTLNIKVTTQLFEYITCIKLNDEIIASGKLFKYEFNTKLNSGLNVLKIETETDNTSKLSFSHIGYVNCAFEPNSSKLYSFDELFNQSINRNLCRIYNVNAKEGYVLIDIKFNGVSVVSDEITENYSFTVELVEGLNIIEFVTKNI